MRGDGSDRRIGSDNLLASVIKQSPRHRLIRSSGLIDSRILSSWRGEAIAIQDETVPEMSRPGSLRLKPRDDGGGVLPYRRPHFCVKPASNFPADALDR